MCYTYLSTGSSPTPTNNVFLCVPHFRKLLITYPYTTQDTLDTLLSDKARYWRRLYSVYQKNEAATQQVITIQRPILYYTENCYILLRGSDLEGSAVFTTRVGCPAPCYLWIAQISDGSSTIGLLSTTSV